MSRILIVDDKQDNVYLLRALLTGHGCEVDEARNGAEALVKARLSPPDLVISDLLMPVMDGYTLLRHWKSDERLRQIPFVVYTATYTEPQDERLALSLGADAFIVKPTEPEPFIALIQEVLAKGNDGLLFPAKHPTGDEDVQLKQYNESLIRKLEKRALQLEQANRALEEDIAERNRTERLLRVSEERFKLVLEGSQLGFWDWNIETGEVIRDERWAEMLGYTLEEVEFSVEPWTDLLHPDDRAAALKSIDDHLNGLTPVHQIEYRMRAKDDRYRWILDHGKVVQRNARGKPVRMCGTHTDITERILARIALEESERQYRQLIEQAADGIFITDEAGRFVLVNSKTCEMLGYTREEFLGLSFIDTYPSEMEDTCREQLASIQPGKTLRFERLMKRKGGGVFWMEASVAKLEDGRQQAIIHDITERRSDEAERARLIMAIEQVDEGIMITDENWIIQFVNPAF